MVFNWKCLAGVALCLQGVLVHAQLDSAVALQQARADIEVLCADSLAGRGYVYSGHTKAANYLQRRFEGLGLQSWQQSFPLTVNLLSEAAFALDGSELGYGADYLVAPYSNTLKGTYTVLDLGYGLLNEWRANYASAKGKLVVVREGLPVDHGMPDSLAREFGSDGFKISAAVEVGAAGIVILRKKLTAGYAAGRYPVAILEVRQDRWPVRGAKKAQVATRPRVQTLTTQNVLAYIPGQSSDTAIVVTAHYDHLGQVNDAVFAGASDNASGAAVLLALAERLSTQQPYYSVLFIATGGEEAGLVGSKAYVASLADRMDTKTGAYVRACLNFDLMGNGQDGLVAVAGKDYPQLYAAAAKCLGAYLPGVAIRSRKNRPNSDHYPFTQTGVPALFWYTEGGIPNYHDIYDRPDQIELPVFWGLLQAFEYMLLEKDHWQTVER